MPANLGNPIACELCTCNIVMGTIYKAKIHGFANPVVVCEACRRSIIDAEKQYHDGRMMGV